MPFYKPERDGTIENYLKNRRETNLPFAFRGLEPYQQLWDKGYIAPGIASIRLVFSHARSDEHYCVVSEQELEGVELPVHSGKAGIHDPREILTGKDFSWWEISGLNPIAWRPSH
ncbi:MAG: hypothetical protein HYW26_02785 [Candidatus Aenigmarchaeota archaeon]|nr:hypothetical protein [Candidatus Aenigmarchaeota archaeon]